jgi:glycosyltransferase involved in cell wall biosynthesis
VSTPLVSIASAFYNTGPRLLDMVKSIFRQSFSDWELILLDDGSTDDSLELAKSIDDSRVRVFSSDRNLGIPTSLNKLTDLSRGKYISRMDSDDMSGRTRIEKQVQFMESHPDIDVISCGKVSLDENDNPIGHRFAGVTHEEICKRPGLIGKICYPEYGMCHPVLFAGRSWFEKNRYNEAISRSSDYELFLRTHQTSRYANIPEPLFYYRLTRTFNLGKQFRHRRDVAKFTFNYHARQGRYDRAILNAVYRYAKLAAEAAYCAVGAKDKLLARRYDAITPEQRDSYREEIKQIKDTALPVRKPIETIHNIHRSIRSFL